MPEQSRSDRLRLITRLAHKVDLLLPVGQTHADLTGAITSFADFLKQSDLEFHRERLQCASKITTLTRGILRDEIMKVESSLLVQGEANSGTD